MIFILQLNRIAYKFLAGFQKGIYLNEPSNKLIINISEIKKNLI